MISTKITHRRKKTETFTGDMLIYCLDLDSEDKVNVIATSATNELEEAISLGDFNGKHGESLLIYPQIAGEKNISSKRILFVSLGQLNEKSTSELREICRKTGGVIASQAKRVNGSNLCLNLPYIQGLSAEEVSQCLVEGVLLGDYCFNKYKAASKKGTKPKFKGIKQLEVFSVVGSTGLRRGINRAQSAAAAACCARDMANEPGNGWTAANFAAYGRSIAKQHGLKCSVLGMNDMKRLEMGGLLAVNQGSAEPPKLVTLEYKSSKKDAQTILLVGKGLTFDSGGVSLKPAAGMQDMKYDMCGGAAAICTMAVVGEEKPDVNVVAIIPATDNMSGSRALKPGDIIRHFGGITSEIVNTDAEGRLIIADALAYGIKKFNPTCVVDLATLTGAVIMGLGHHRTGLLGNNQTVIDRLLGAGEQCGERLWQLPLDEEYSKQIDSDVADIKNSGGRPAGTITAAAYLQKFVGDTPWAHLDIAGTAWDFTEKSYIPKGPSGTGVRTLIEFIRNWKKLS